MHALRLRACLMVAGASLLAAAAIAVTTSGGGVASAKTRPALVTVSAKLAAASPTIPATMTCSALATLPSLVTIPGNPTSIDTATDVAASGTNPEYCDVKGMIAPQTHFEMKLPVKTWQGRYLQNGCGGYCGAVSAQSFPQPCDAELGGDFAMATDDEGHTSDSGIGGAGLFAFNSQNLRKEYGYESEHALEVVAKTIIKDFYGVGPNYSYFDGCSDGGREAMEVAERYPTDFNGIIAGAPEIIAGPLNAELQTWDYKVNVGPNGNAILTSAQMTLLHNAVITACQGDDGVPGDGIITDPRDCNFSPQSLVCQNGATTGCLTPEQAKVAEEIYQGPVDPQGRHLYPGGLTLGSESSWAGFQIPVQPSTAPVPATNALVYGGLSLPYLRFMLNAPGKLGPDPSQWQFTDQGFRSMFPAANVQDAMSTDLSAFRRHGGKLIIWQGWADQAIPTYGTVDYYEDLASATAATHRRRSSRGCSCSRRSPIAAAGTHPAASTSCTRWSSGWRTGPLRARSRRPIRSTARRSLARFTRTRRCPSTTATTSRPTRRQASTRSSQRTPTTTPTGSATTSSTSRSAADPRGAATAGNTGHSPEKNLTSLGPGPGGRITRPSGRWSWFPRRRRGAGMQPLWGGATSLSPLAGPQAI